ncbi:MAG: DUF5350 domain-containing protein [Methanomicrobiales archaeon]|nr:DUF5350 domain-containing protein [Methanomicrobiales archaeon]
MGKTGTVAWVQVKGTKGQIRLVPRKESEHKKPGPNQRFKRTAAIKKFERASADQRGGGRGGNARGGGRSGGRGAARGQPADLRSMAARRRVSRPKSMIMGAKK